MSQPSTQSLRDAIAQWPHGPYSITDDDGCVRDFSVQGHILRCHRCQIEVLLPAIESALGERQALNETISYQVAYRFKLWVAADALYKWVRGGDIGMYKTQEQIMSALKEALYDTDQDAALR